MWLINLLQKHLRIYLMVGFILILKKLIFIEGSNNFKGLQKNNYANNFIILTFEIQLKLKKWQISH